MVSRAYAKLYDVEGAVVEDILNVSPEHPRWLSTCESRREMRCTGKGTRRWVQMGTDILSEISQNQKGNVYTCSCFVDLRFYIDNIKSKNEAISGNGGRGEKEEEKGIDIGDVCGQST